MPADAGEAFSFFATSHPRNSFVLSYTAQATQDEINAHVAEAKRITFLEKGDEAGGQ